MTEPCGRRRGSWCPRRVYLAGGHTKQRAVLECLIALGQLVKTHDPAKCGFLISVVSHSFRRQDTNTHLIVWSDACRQLAWAYEPQQDEHLC